jgi:hypothetical protein
MSRIGPCVGPDQAHQNEIAGFLRGRSITRECAADMGSGSRRSGAYGASPQKTGGTT